MKDSLAPPNFPKAPDQFDPAFLDDYTRRLLLFLREMLSTGSCDVNTLRIMSVPTSASGLAVGSVFSDNNTLKIVLAVINQDVTGLSATGSVGTVTINLDWVETVTGLSATGSVGTVTILTP